MKKYLLRLACILFLFLFIMFPGCSWEDKIEEGTYICDDPYIKFTCEFGNGHMSTQEIEVDGVVRNSITTVGEGNIFFYEYQEEDIRPTDGIRMYDNEIYAKFHYQFNKNKKQLILTEWETGTVYYLDKVDQ